MKKFVPYEKLSKKAQRKINQLKRSTWNGLNPSTRIADDSNKKYKRVKYNYLKDET